VSWGHSGLANLGWVLLHNDSGQVIHTYVCFYSLTLGQQGR